MSDKKQKSKSPKAQTAKEIPVQKADPPAEAEAPEETVEAESEAPEETVAADLEATQKSGWSAGELEALKAENAELKDRLLRTAAEMENLRKRTERDKADTAKYAISSFARDVLTIADNIQRAIDHVPEEAAEKDPTLKSFRDGMQVTERELLNMMERHGITRHDPKGDRFDPNKHQAMFEVPNPDVPEGTVIEVVQPGYIIAERVLRPALVGIAKGGAKAPKPEPSAEAEIPKAANDDSPDAGAPPEGKPDADGVGGNFDTSA